MLNNLFKEYIELQPDSEVMYYPDSFIKEIHKNYLDDSKIYTPHPLYATWDIVEECNLNCLFCSADSKNVNVETISNPSSIDIAKMIIKSGIVYVSIRGGEPTLCKELIKVISLLIENNIFVELVTNGKNINENFFENLRNKSLLRIKISLDDSNKEINDFQRGRESFNNAVKAIETCRRKNLNYENNSTINLYCICMYYSKKFYQ
jgi:MoaA/NifB/PqqE/SkfB family radical SAM enzyme